MSREAPKGDGFTETLKALGVTVTVVALAAHLRDMYLAAQPDQYATVVQFECATKGAFWLAVAANQLYAASNITSGTDYAGGQNAILSGDTIWQSAPTDISFASKPITRTTVYDLRVPPCRADMSTQRILQPRGR